MLCRYSQLRDSLFFFFFNDTATTEIYTLSLHDALPIFPLREAYSPAFAPKPTPQSRPARELHAMHPACEEPILPKAAATCQDRKSTRLNSSHANISYAVFCLKKKKMKKKPDRIYMPICI